jgi:dynein heavy chain
MEPGALGNEPLVKSWLNTCPPAFKTRKQMMPNLEACFNKYMPPMLKFMRKNCFEPVHSVDNNIVQSLMRILDCYFASYYDNEFQKVSPEDVEDFE